MLIAWAILPWALRAEDAPAPDTAPPPAAVAPAPVEAPPAEPPPPALENPVPAVPAQPAPETPVAAPAAPSSPVAPLPPPVEAEQPAAMATPETVNRGEMVTVGSAVTIAANESAQVVVAVFGDVTVAGRVKENAVAVWGDVKVDGKVGENLVAVAGSVYLNGPVRENLVCVFGTVELGPKAVVHENLVVVGGALSNPHGAPIRGQKVVLGADAGSLWSGFVWLKDGLFRGRLLVPGLGWSWLVFGGVLAFYLLLALLFNRGVNACARALEERPGGTLLTAFVMVPLMPVLCVLLSIATLCIGAPFIAVGVVFAKVFGKVAFLAFLGRCSLRAFGAEKPMERAVFTVAIGGAILAMLYCVPVMGILVFWLSGWVGFGMVVSAILARRRKSKEEKRAAQGARSAPAAAVRPASVLAPMAVAVTPAPGESAAPRRPTEPPQSAGFIGATAMPAAPADAPPQPAVSTAPAPLPSLTEETSVSAVASPRASFWVRAGALAIDVVVVAAGISVVPLIGAGFFPWAMGLYCGGMWFWRSTTVGGVVFNLRIVRLDGRSIDGATIVVRTLVGYLSMVSPGFLWCIWDPEKQSWHDKVAGTVVVRTPKGVPLV